MRRVFFSFSSHKRASLKNIRDILIRGGTECRSRVAVSQVKLARDEFPPNFSLKIILSAIDCDW